MKTRLIILTVAFGLTTTVFAETIRTTVNGMVCAFCATGIEKTFRKQPEVESVKVDLPSKQVTIKTKPGKTLSDAKVKEIVTYSGYTDGKNRPAKVTAAKDWSSAC
jgi:mercuric ion binding protein